MSTRSRIAVIDGKTIKSIHCHWDGYPASIMPMLAGFYKTQKKAFALVENGYISSLYPSLEQINKYRPRNDKHATHGSIAQLVYLFKEGMEQFLYIFDAADKKWRAFDKEMNEIQAWNEEVR